MITIIWPRERLSKTAYESMSIFHRRLFPQFMPVPLLFSPRYPCVLLQWGWFLQAIEVNLKWNICCLVLMSGQVYRKCHTLKPSSKHRNQPKISVSTQHYSVVGLPLFFLLSTLVLLLFFVFSSAIDTVGSGRWTKWTMGIAYLFTCWPFVVHPMLSETTEEIESNFRRSIEG